MKVATPLLAAILSIAAPGAFAGESPRAASAPLPLQQVYVFTATVKVAPIISMGKVPLGERRFIPITGGTVAGPMMTGRVLEGSGDWQVLRADGTISLEARYILEAEDGTRIAVVNRGMRVASPAVTARMMKGEPVEPSEYYFRTAAEFEAPVGSRYEWMNKALFVGVAERKSDAAIVHFYQIK